MTTPSPVQYDELLVEILKNNPTYSDMADAIDVVFTNNIDKPLGTLKSLRALRQTDDVNCRLSTIRLLGFDVAQDFLTLNPNIANIPYMFSRYYENSHGNDFFKFISFALGRNISVVPLYTADYNSFYEIPYGPLNIDGGDWYQTTHVDVVVDINNLNNQLLPNPGLSYQDRVVELFYGYAPVQMVIKTFLFSLTLNTNFGFVADTVQAARLMCIGGQGLFGGQDLGQLQSLVIYGDLTIVQGQSKHYSLGLVWSPAYTETIPFMDFVSSDTSALSIDSTGTALAKTITFDTSVTVSAVYAGFTASLSVNVVAAASVVFEISINIVGPATVDENTVQQYLVTIVWSDNSTTTESSGVNLEWTTQDSTIDFTNSNTGSLTVNSVNANAEATLYLQYTNILGTLLNAYKTITIINVGNAVFLKSISVIGPNIVEALSTTTFTCSALMSDNSSHVVTPIWYLPYTAAVLTDQGVFTAINVIKDSQVTIHVFYEYAGVQQTNTFQVLIKQAVYNVSSGSIIGPATALQKQYTQYSLSITWTNGIHTLVQADSWTSTKFTIDDTGLLNVGSVGYDNSSIITALFHYAGVQHTYTKTVSLIQSVLNVNSLTLMGPQSISLGDLSQYTAILHYSDGSKVSVPTNSSNVSWSVDNTRASINPTGVLTLSSTPNSTILTVTCTYVGLDATGASITLTDSLYVGVTSVLPTLLNVVITGSTSLIEMSREQYICTAFYSNAVQEIVIPYWTVSVTNTGLSPDDVAIIDRNGLLYVRTLDDPTVINLTAQFYSASATLQIACSKYEYYGYPQPFAATITGSTNANVGDNQYVFTITDLPTSVPRQLYASWSINVVDTVATIDPYGTMTVLPSLAYNVSAILTATYSCGYDVPVVATLNIVINEIATTTATTTTPIQ